MPELPEVETTRRGIAPHLVNETVADIIIRNPAMRWPIPDDVRRIIKSKITSVDRRAKYLLLRSAPGTLMLHLGMSGSLRICEPSLPYKKHDHFVLCLKNNTQLRLHDPRRFGAVLWLDKPDKDHPLLTHLGPEPLEDTFSPEYFHHSCQGKKTTIKQHIMNNKVVVGVGNIYACEALFRCGIHPKRQAGRISNVRTKLLHQEIRKVLSEAITQGGTTLRDFLNESGEPGYFKQRLTVYGRENEPCRLCQTSVRRVTISNRSTFYCPKCQK